MNSSSPVVSARRADRVTLRLYRSLSSSTVDAADSPRGSRWAAMNDARSPVGAGVGGAAATGGEGGAGGGGGGNTGAGVAVLGTTIACLGGGRVTTLGG